MEERVGPARERAKEKFFEKNGFSPSLVARSPGRVNLIGEHTDYNDGFVLPIALSFDTAIAAAPVEGSKVSVFSEGYGEITFDLNDDPTNTLGWGRYLHGVGAFLHSSGKPAAGWIGCIATDIPTGANLASSAALEVASGLIFSSVSDLEIDLVQLAQCGQYVENQILGLPSGIMDQMTCALAESNSALLIDCRDLSTQTIKIPENVTVVVMDTGTRRELVETGYADRRLVCERAADVLGVHSLREATLEDLEQLETSDTQMIKRAQHVISENERTELAVAALRSNNPEELGRLMTESHMSLQSDFEVSSPALDQIVQIALKSRGCFGARMTGGGFAGCAIALVESIAIDEFCHNVLESFTAPKSQPAEISTSVYPVKASAGASLIQ